MLIFINNMSTVTMEKCESAPVLLKWNTNKEPRIGELEYINGKVLEVEKILRDRQHNKVYVMVDDPYRRY